MMKSDEIAALAKALSAFQGELRAAPKDSANSYFKSRYASLATIWDTCREPLAKHGLAVSQLLGTAGEQLLLVTLLMHESGEWLASELLLTPVKLDPQGVGSAITYARRYALSAILGVVADDDDDAEAAMGRGSALDSAPEPMPAAPRDRPMPQAIAIAPKGLCPQHHIGFVRRSGVGTRGAYDFWACPQRVGQGFCAERPQPEHTGEAATTSPSAQSTSPGFGATSPVPDAQAASPKPAMDINQFWAEMNGVQGWPHKQPRESERLLKQALNMPETQQLNPKWTEGIDLRVVLERCKDIIVQGRGVV